MVKCSAIIDLETVFESANVYVLEKDADLSRNIALLLLLQVPGQHLC